jgi:hypothetical protein
MWGNDRPPTDVSGTRETEGVPTGAVITGAISRFRSIFIGVCSPHAAL